MQFEPKFVSIESIDLENTLYKITTPKPIEGLVESIDRFGLLSPPILQSYNNGYIVVGGFHRIYAGRKIGWNDIEARVMGADSKKIDCLKVSIADNIYHREMNLIEQSIALSKLACFCEAESDFINSAKVFGFSDNPSYLNKLLKLHTLIPELQQSILSGAIPMTIALEIGSFDQESMSQIIDLFARLRPTLNQQKEMLSMLKEISKVRNSPVEKILKEKNILDIINHPDLARAQKIKDLRAFFKNMRLPFLTSYYERFNALITRLELPDKLKLIPPENFEDVDYSMTLRFDSFQEFESSLEVLKRLSGNVEFKAIFGNHIAAQ